MSVSPNNQHPPAVTPPSPFEWPQNLVQAITQITNDSQATLTVPSHGFTSEDVGQTFVMIKQVVGMDQINGQNALIESIVDSSNFTVDIDTTNYHIYRSAGVCITDSGSPPVETQSFQTFNTPFQNIAT